MKPIRAEMSRSYLIRLGLVALFSIGLSFFCLYDGWVRYPQQRERAIAYRQIYDAALETISPRAVSASRSLAASRPPAQWSEKQWSDRVKPGAQSPGRRDNLDTVDCFFTVRLALSATGPGQGKRD